LPLEGGLQVSVAHLNRQKYKSGESQPLQKEPTMGIKGEEGDVQAREGKDNFYMGRENKEPFPPAEAKKREKDLSFEKGRKPRPL